MSDSADRIGAEWINFSLFIVGVRKVGVNRLCPARLCGATTLWAVGKIIGQIDAAQRSGVHEVHISDLERGSREVGLSTLKSIADSLEVPMADLFKGL